MHEIQLALERPVGFWCLLEHQERNLEASLDVVIAKERASELKGYKRVVGFFQGFCGWDRNRLQVVVDVGVQPVFRDVYLHVPMLAYSVRVADRPGFPVPAQMMCV